MYTWTKILKILRLFIFLHSKPEENLIPTDFYKRNVKASTGLKRQSMNLVLGYEQY